MNEQRPFKKILHDSVQNMRQNRILILLLLALTCCVVFVFLFKFDSLGTSTLGATIIVLLAKAESRPQPGVVVFLAAVSSLCTIVAVLKGGGVGRTCDWIAIAVLVPLIFSKYLLTGRKGTA